MINTVFFDLDGTLLDTAPDLAHAINQTLLSHGRKPIEYSQFRYSVYGGSKLMLCQGFGIDENHPKYDAISKEFLQHYADNLAKETCLFPGVQQLLDFLADHDIPWGIVTNKPAHLAEPLLKALDLFDPAICVVSGDTLEKSKPHPAPIQHACKISRREAGQSVYIGDTESDIQAARAARMRSIAVLYGYAPYGSQPERWRADLMVKEAQQIIPWLERRIK